MTFFGYYKLKASVRIARQLVDSIVNCTIALENQPYIGQLEELLQDRPQNFRYLIHKNYKIIYWVNESSKRVGGVHVFDTRQNPIKLRKAQ